MKLIAALLFALCPVQACLWDSDTIRDELEGNTEPARIITGWFNRYPPLYYEMRLARVSEALAKDDTTASFYDDAAVACDRLGNPTAAIAWMEKKEKFAATEATKPGEPNTKYKTLANLGTFYAHRWIKATKAGKQANDEDLAQAIFLIQEAIRENPDAHFGREKYQLLLLQWLGGEDNLIAEMARWNGFAGAGEERDNSELIEGLLGLVRLGAAWESPDIYYLLQASFGANELEHPRLLANLRVAELLADGRTFLSPELKPLFLDPANAQKGSRIQDWKDVSPTISFYESARTAAEARDEAFKTYLVARMQKGLHPDTDPDFFEAWNEPDFPELPEASLLSVRPVLSLSPFLMFLTFFAVIAILLLALVLAVRTLLKKFS